MLYSSCILSVIELVYIFKSNQIKFIKQQMAKSHLQVAKTMTEAMDYFSYWDARFSLRLSLKTLQSTCDQHKCNPLIILALPNYISAKLLVEAVYVDVHNVFTENRFRSRWRGIMRIRRRILRLSFSATSDRSVAPRETKPSAKCPGWN